jgi:Carboxypeptidase regulatory-like domain
MASILLALLLLHAGPQNSGAVTGFVRSGAGNPAAGVRVYAQQVRDQTDTNSPAAPLEGMSQTDASGRYRLELPAGRYYIASGSVSAPTYYPGTTDIGAAKLVAVTASGLVEGIDFAGFVTANRGGLTSIPSPPPPPVGGTLTGVVRYPDGTPAARVRVIAYTVPTTVSPGTPAIAPAFRTWSVVTDAAGRYRFNNIAPNTYQIVAGLSESYAHHTGDPGSTTPKGVVLPSTATIDSLDIALPFPPAPVGTTVKGRLLTRDGAPAVGSTVTIVRQSFSPFPVSGISLPSVSAVPAARVVRDGTFQFSNVVPGTYNVQTSIGSVNQQHSIEVGNTPVTNLQFSLPTIVLSGQILFEDGSPVPDVELFGAGVLSTVGNSNMTLSRMLRFSSGGLFGTEDVKGLLEHREYRFHFLNNPAEYEIRSITAGPLNLQTETLRIDGSSSIFIEARIGPRKGGAADSIRVMGTSFDNASTSNVSSNATRVYLSRVTESSEKFSAPLRADGYFEFVGIPPGQYTITLQAKSGQLWVVGAMTEATSDGVKLQLRSATARPAAPMVTIEIPNRP